MKASMALGCVLLLTSCAMERLPPSPARLEAEAAFWPPAPAQARVRYLYSFGGPDELGFKVPVSRQLKNWLGGSEDLQMVRPYAIAVSSGLIAVTDPGLGLVHLYDTKAGHYQRLKAPGGLALASPVGVALGENRIFVADSADAKLFIFDAKSRVVGVVDDLQRPTGLAFEPNSQRLYVADTKAHEVRVYDRDGKFVKRFGGRGEGGGEFNFPTHLAISSERLFINDTMNFRIQVCDLDGVTLAVFGEHGDSAGYLAQPKGVGVSTDGYVFVAESVRGRIQVFDIAGQFLMDFGFPAESLAAFYLPAGLAISGDRIYVADSGSRRVQVFEYLGAE